MGTGGGWGWGRGAHLLGAALDAAVLAGHVLAVPVVGGAAREAEVGVALAHGQVARALLGVALRLAAAAGEAVLTCRGRPHHAGRKQSPRVPPAHPARAGGNRGHGGRSPPGSWLSVCMC